MALYPEEVAEKHHPMLQNLWRRLDNAVGALRDMAELSSHLDAQGAAEDHPVGSQAREWARLRDHFDFMLSCQIDSLSHLLKKRVETTRSLDLLVEGVIGKRGDAQDTLRLMRRCHALFGDDTLPDGEALEETFPELFVWDTYQRVSALAQLAEEYPKHVRHAARRMRGWPMIVSHHLDGRAEFARLAARLELGRDYPLDVSPRRKRGTETALLRYLEPLLGRFDDCRWWLLHWGGRKWPQTDLDKQNAFLLSDWTDPRPGPEVAALLRKLPTLPPLTKKSTLRWSREIIVPIIMATDTGERATCQVPALLNLWRHRGVKSRGTFKSHLQSAVMDTLQRFARPD